MKKVLIGLSVFSFMFLLGCSQIQKSDADSFSGLNQKISNLESGLNTLLIQNQRIIEENNVLSGKINEIFNQKIGSIAEKKENSTKIVQKQEVQSGGKILSLSEAKKIAEASSCNEAGTISDNYQHNDMTHTRWVDINSNDPKSNCNPACVVDDLTSTAEINWRCLGLRK